MVVVAKTGNCEYGNEPASYAVALCPVVHRSVQDSHPSVARLGVTAALPPFPDTPSWRAQRHLYFASALIRQLQLNIPAMLVL